MEIYAGLDVHSKNTVYCIQSKDGEVLAQGEIATDAQQLACMFKRHKVAPGTRVGLETGTQAHWMAETLFKLGMEPVVIDAGEVRRKARRRSQKCDSRDAFEICDGLRRQQWEKIVWLPPAEIRQMRELLSRRRSFVSLRAKQINCAKFILRSHGIATSRMTLQSDMAWQRVINAHPAHAQFVQLHREFWCQACKTIAQLDEQLQQCLECFGHRSELLQTCFGVGPVVAATFIAAIGDASRFATSNHVVSYLGLAPSTYDSGERQRRGRITHEGPRWARSALVESAHQARRRNHPLQPYYRRMAAKTGIKCAAVAVAARLARILWRMWSDNQAFDLSKLNVCRSPKTTLKTTIYQMKETTMAKAL